MIAFIRSVIVRIVPRDLRYAARAMRRARSFFALSVLSLAIGIGLSTATFAYVDASLNPKLPYADATQLTFAQLDVARWQRSPRQRDLIDAIGALPFVEGVTQLNYETRKELRGNGLGGRPDVSRFAPNFFVVTGVRPQLGRWPTADESRAGSAAVVSANLWSRGFLNRRQIGDAHVTVDGQTMPIVGVLPPGMFLGADVWIPYPSNAFLDSAGTGGAPPIVRLRKGMTRAAINGQLATAAARLQAMYVADPRGRPYLLTLHSYLFAGQRPGDKELSLIGLALGILLISASNVAALALARAYARRRDFALRVALGASRAAIACELFSEIGVIAVFGALLGAACSAALIGILTLMTPAELLGAGAVYGVRLPVLTPHLFVYVISGLVVSVVIAGGVPAWRASHVDPAGPLKNDAGTTTGRTKSEFRILLIGELAVAMALITVTSLLLISARNLARFDFGFDLRKPVEARISFVLPDDRPLTSERNYASVLARVRTTPGVAMASTFMPTGFVARKIVSRPSFGSEHTLEPDGQIYDAGPDAFRTLGITMLEGRDFTDGDRLSGDAVILSERAARGLFPRRNAIGSTITIGGEESKYQWMRVIGVVPDVRLGTAGRGDPEVFVSSKDAAAHGNLTVIARPAERSPQFMSELERSLSGALPPNSSVYVHRMAESFDLQLDVTRFYSRTLTFLGLCALLLATIGLFSVLSFTAGRRMREFAVRIALGATPRQVLVVVMKDGFEMALGGAAIGAGLSFWASAGISGLLFGMTITDPVALMVAEGLLLAAATGASIIPAIRATKADPTEVLRAI